MKQVPDNKQEYNDVNMESDLRSTNKMTFRPNKGLDSNNPLNNNRIPSFGEAQQSAMDTSSAFDRKNTIVRFSNFYDKVAFKCAEDRESVKLDENLKILNRSKATDNIVLVASEIKEEPNS